ncbi:Holliday junction branch migration protein RuvA [Candidatus Saccharibacteria bacterium]|nr:Holliday junction branch migration protein RuvA [Candidatus Saccharibacteria bacterium]
MIAHLRGTVSEKFEGTVIIDVHGVGYEVAVAAHDFDALQLDDTAKIYTYHHVREQAEELFGFSSLMAKKLFELLISVQSVGPKAALAVLSLGSAEAVRNAIATSDIAYVQQASGVGKKTAERVVVDLRDKVGAPSVYGRVDNSEPVVAAAEDEALEALMALGYTLADATKALSGIDTALSTSDRVTQALRARDR